jgi:hypothetical protein
MGGQKEVLTELAMEDAVVSHWGDIAVEGKTKGFHWLALLSANLIGKELRGKELSAMQRMRMVNAVDPENIAHCIAIVGALERSIRLGSVEGYPLAASGCRSVCHVLQLSFSNFQVEMQESS